MLKGNPGEADGEMSAFYHRGWRRDMKTCVVVSIAGAFIAGSAAHGATVAYWAFPVPAQTPNYGMTWPIAADASVNPGATLDTDAPKYDGTPAPNAIAQGSMQYFGGSAVNMQPTYAIGQAISMRNDSLDRAQNKSLILNFSTLGEIDMVLSFAERYSSTGPTGVTIQYSTDGVAYTAATNYLTTRDGAFAAGARVIDLSAIDTIENLSSVYLKITFTGFNVNGTGTARIDNILVSSVPSPGALALFGVAGVLGVRRRR
jgi:MYXO-CTERM domain-containing protein